MPLRVFPVVGTVIFADDFGFVKPDGRRHQGIDIHAPKGAAIVAVDDGVAAAGVDPRGGNVVNLTTADGRYYYAHLDSPGLTGPVVAGDTLGAVGTSGNAQGTSPHLHFEWHPQGGPAVDPYKLLRAAEGLPMPSTAKASSGVLAALGIVASALLVAIAIKRH